jgi:cell division protein FtsL
MARTPPVPPTRLPVGRPHVTPATGNGPGIKELPLSALTKVFVVLLVILSLLLAAASITFLHTVPDYNSQIATLNTSLSGAQAQTERVRAAESASRAAADARAAQLDGLLSDANASIASLRGELARVQAEKTDLQGQIAQSNTTQSTLSNAVSANMALVNTLRDEVAALREEYDRTLQQNLDLGAQLAKMSNEYEYIQRAFRASEERNKDAMSRIGTLEGQLVAAGIDPKSDQTPVAPPPINGVIVQRMAIEGQPFALISVGAEDDVKPGMRFAVIDDQTSQLLGFVTVEQVDDQVSIGKLSGDRIDQVAPDDQVKTETAV